jgi:hypothetical protein
MNPLDSDIPVTGLYQNIPFLRENHFSSHPFLSNCSIRLYLNVILCSFPSYFAVCLKELFSFLDFLTEKAFSDAYVCTKELLAMLR